MNEFLYELKMTLLGAFISALIIGLFVLIVVAFKKRKRGEDDE